MRIKAGRNLWVSLISLNETVEVLIQRLTALSAFVFVDELTLNGRYCMVRVGSRYSGLELSFASLENNSGLSIQGQALELIPGCGWGQQL